MDKKEKMVKSFDLIEETWKVYIKNLSKFIMVLLYGLIGFIPMIVLFLLIFIYNASGLASAAPMLTNIILGIIGIILFGFSLYFAIVYSLKAKVASILLLKNNFTPAKENFKQATPYIERFLGVSLLLVVLIIAWGIVFIIPALIFGIYYGLSAFVLVLEDKRPFTSIERSYDLVKGYWWPVFGRFTLIATIVFVLYAIISLPLSWMSQNSAGSIIYGGLTNIVWLVLSPYFIIFTYNVYKSLKHLSK